MTNYITEGHEELDLAVSIDKSYARRFDALTFDQRRNIALAIAANLTEFHNDKFSGKETVFATEEETIEAAAEGQLVEEESK